MSDETNIGWKTRLLRLWALAMAHPEIVLLTITHLAAFVLGMWAAH